MEHKLDRTAFSVVSLSQQDEEEKAYWRGKTRHERLEAVEETRRMIYGYDPLPPDFSEFLRLLEEHEVRYLLVGGYAVGYYGYVRATADMDIWVERERINAERLVEVLRNFGFGDSDPNPRIFLEESRVIRMGVPPIRIELLTSVSGVEFECYAERIVEHWDDLSVNIISLSKRKANKRASGRLKDLSDLEYLE